MRPPTLSLEWSSEQGQQEVGLNHLALGGERRDMGAAAVGSSLREGLDNSEGPSGWPKSPEPEASIPKPRLLGLLPVLVCDGAVGQGFLTSCYIFPISDTLCGQKALPLLCVQFLLWFQPNFFSSYPRLDACWVNATLAFKIYLLLLSQAS